MENFIGQNTYGQRFGQWGPCHYFLWPTGCTYRFCTGDPQNNLDVFFKVPANYEIPNTGINSAERMIWFLANWQSNLRGEIENTMKVGSYALLAHLS